MAVQVIEPGGAVPPEENIYRALNPRHFEDGLPVDNHFVMTRRDRLGDGVSTGITSLISLSQLRSIETIRQRYGDDFGVAELNVAEALAPVRHIGIGLLQSNAPDWGAFAGAHAVITGYQLLRGDDRKKRMQDFQRHLVQLARKRFYPAGSSVPLGSE
ncbi:MAG: hypothetical protein WA419_14115 [Silvibacterium sp.]